MRLKRRIRIKIEDESRLRDIFRISMSPSAIILTIAGFCLFSILASAFIIMVTPLKTYLPGYLKKSEKIATTESLLKLDSLKDQIEANNAYIDNILTITDINREPQDSELYSRGLPRSLSGDSLIRQSESERKFVNMMRRRERYNISVLAPLAADGMMFVPPAENAVFMEKSKTDFEGTLAVSPTSPIGAIADGIVLAAYHSPAEGGFVVIIQHDRGFISRYSHLGLPAVDVGDAVNASQAIAAPNTGAGRTKSIIKLRIWHNGQPLRPFDYIATGTPTFVNRSI